MKTEVKAMKRKSQSRSDVLYDQDYNMANNKDQEKKKCHIDETITSDPAAKVIAVELNKRLPQAKENKQDAIPSDDEDGYPELNLNPDEIEKRKRQRKENISKGNSQTNYPK